MSLELRIFGEVRLVCELKKQENWIGVVERPKLLVNTSKANLQTLVSDQKKCSLSLQKLPVPVASNIFSTS